MFKTRSLFTSAKLLAATSAILLASCTAVKKFNTMQDDTAQIKDETHQMKDQTTSLSDKTEEMKDTTNELYDSLRQVNAKMMRDKAWDALLQAAKMADKITEAATYEMAFEVQNWNLSGQDQGSIEKRDSLAQQAAEEFFMAVEGLAPSDGSIRPFVSPKPNAINSEQNREASFDALALTTARINRKQAEVLAVRRDLQPITIESMLEEALLAKSDLEHGGPAAAAKLGSKMGYINEVLVHEEKALQILQTRYNLFPMIVIEAVSSIGEKGFWTQLWMDKWSWTLDLDQLNLEQLQFFELQCLQPALQARDFLKSIGQKPEMKASLVGLLEHMKIKVSETPVTPEVATTRASFIALFKDLKDHAAE